MSLELKRSFIFVLMLSTAACTTMEPTAIPTNHTVRHTLPEMAHKDSVQMVSLVQNEIDSNERDDDRFYNVATDVLAETILVQRNAGTREAGIKALRSKLENEEDYIFLLKRATDKLLSQAGTTNLADQAATYVALTSVAIELRTIQSHARNGQDVRPILLQIANANLEVSDELRNYVRNYSINVTSPSSEARVSLENLEKPTQI